jgi:hypothetical protein
MHSAPSPDTTQDIANADAAGAAAKQRRLSTTVTLLGVVACVFLAKTLAIGAPAMPAAAAAPQHGATLGVTPVTIVAPEFCKNQTWPYIDARCLRRVDNPPPAEVRNASTAPTNSAAVNSGPVNSGPVNSGPVNSGPVTAPPAAAPIIYDGVPPSPEASPAAAPSQVIQTVFPVAEPGAAAQNDLQNTGAVTPVGTTTYQRVDDAARPHPPRHGHHGFFPFGGFRF